MRHGLAAAALVGALVGPVACDCNKSESPAPDKSGASKDAHALREDIRKACEHRAAWPERLRSKCTKCVSLSAAPKCGCKTDQREYSGLCSDAKKAKLADKDCVETYDCAYACKPTDCECVAKCYQGKDECHKLAAEVEGCVAEICEPYCNGSGTEPASEKPGH